MTTMRNLLLAFALLFSTAVLADDYAYLRVSGSAGEAVFTVSQIDRITFDTQDMVLRMTDGTEQRLSLATLDRMFFSADGLASVRRVGAGGFSVQGGVLRIDAKSGLHVTLYNIGGQAVRQFTTHSDKAELDIGSLKPGVYLVKVGDETRKIMHK